MRMPLLIAAVFALLSGAAFAQEAAEQEMSSKSAFQRYPDAPSVTRHSVDINGQTINYEATADTLTLVDDEGEPRAKLFYMAYRKIDGGMDSARFPAATDRPITFSFNGGPGSSSVWLHLGIFGPRRVQYADEVGTPGAPP
ncbi:MAG: peptidase S10, partial [Phycisphaerales bacterium]|nr:peptidase S10 [Phycisphaerales bacterium]